MFNVGFELMILVKLEETQAISSKPLLRSCESDKTKIVKKTPFNSNLQYHIKHTTTIFNRKSYLYG